MKSEGFLIAERALAQHSDQLAAKAPDPAQLSASFAAVAPRFERSLCEELISLLGEERPVITCGKVEKMPPAKLHKIIDLVAVNIMFTDAEGGQMLASLDLASALALTDQVFGGAGVAPAILPERLPKATDLTLTRFAEVLGKALGIALERPAALSISARSDVLGKLVPARDEENFLVMRCPIAREDDGSETEKRPWDLIIAMRQSDAPKLLGGSEASARPKRQHDKRSAFADPFAKLPLTLRAVLVDMEVPVSRLSSLQVGDTLPITIPREIPLMVENIEIARGKVGSADGSLALQLTKTAWNEKDNLHD